MGGEVRVAVSWSRKERNETREGEVSSNFRVLRSQFQQYESCEKVDVGTHHPSNPSLLFPT